MRGKPEIGGSVGLAIAAYRFREQLPQFKEGVSRDMKVALVTAPRRALGGRLPCGWRGMAIPLAVADINRRRAAKW